MAVWMPVAKAVKRFGPIVGPLLARKANEEFRPYYEAWQQARRVDGYLGSWQDDDGKHWVVLDRDRASIVRAFPPMAVAEQRTALDNLDVATLQHHSDSPLHKLASAPGKARARLSRRSGGSDDGS